MNVYSDGGAWIRALRESVELTQAELAEMALVDADWLEAVERGLRPVPQRVFARLATVFEMDAATFAAGFGVPVSRKEAA